MRQYLRHPTEMPVELIARKQQEHQQLNNISLGGVACNSQRNFKRGLWVELHVPLLGSEAHYSGVVAWCRKRAGDYLVGIAFTDEDNLFRARMVEQVCQIECYRLQREAEVGHSLPIEEVARDWIALHGAAFAASGHA